MNSFYNYIIVPTFMHLGLIQDHGTDDGMRAVLHFSSGAERTITNKVCLFMWHICSCHIFLAQRKNVNTCKYMLWQMPDGKTVIEVSIFPWTSYRHKTCSFCVGFQTSWFTVHLSNIYRKKLQQNIKIALYNRYATICQNVICHSVTLTASLLTVLFSWK